MNERDALIKAYASGTPGTQLMIDFGLSKGSVLGILNEAGVTRRINSPTPDQVDEAVRLYIEERWSLDGSGSAWASPPPRSSDSSSCAVW